MALSKAEPACFIIADISGYTSFLAACELEHAQDIIADFMNAVVKGLRPPFRLAKFEGDAAFVYSVNEKVDGSLLQETIESAYCKFRRRMRDVKQASLCECKACMAMGDLDFKFVVDYGEIRPSRRTRTSSIGSERNLQTTSPRRLVRCDRVWGGSRLPTRRLTSRRCCLPTGDFRPIR